MISKELVRILLDLPNEQRVGPSGDTNKKLRQRIVFEITGQNCNLSQCGRNRCRNLLIGAFGVNSDGLCIAQVDRLLVEAMQRFVMEEPQ